MKNLNYKLLPICLVVFDGAAAPSSAPAAAPQGGGTGNAAPMAESNIKLPGRSRRALSGDTPKVIYGKPPQNQNSSAAESNPTTPKQNSSGVTTTSDALEARRAEFEKLISGEYKDIFTERTQQIIDRRFKETKTLQAQIEQASPVLEMLKERYKLSSEATPEQIMKALEDDDAYWEAAAEDAGLTVQQYKYMKKLERSNAELQKIRAEQDKQKAVSEIYQKWAQQAEAFKQKNPDFDLKRECENPEYAKLLRVGVDVETAYRVVHFDETVQAVAQTTAQKVESSVINNIRAKGMRPSENGASPTPGVIFKDDVSKLTRRDRAEAVRRAQKGEFVGW